MPVTPTYPGVYIEEIPSGVRTITGVATSVTAFIGRAKRGPVSEPTIVNNLGDFERSFGGLGATYPLSYSVRDFFLNGGSQAIIVRLFHADGSATAELDANGLALAAASAGSWGNSLRARVDHEVAGDLPWVAANGLTADDLFNLTVRDTMTGVTETFANVTVAESPRRVDRVLENQSSLARTTDDDLPDDRPSPHGEPGPADDIWADDALSSPVTTTVSDSAALEDGDYTGSEANKTGIFALEKADLFNLLCLPEDQRGGDTSSAVYQAAMAYCVKRRAMLIVDSPASWSANKETAAADAKAGLNALGLTGVGARNAALYFPRVRQSDPLRDGQSDTFVPCGIIAGLMSRTDVQRGVWKAPAGIDASLNGIQGLNVNLTDPENGMLNPLGINSLRSFPVVGNVAWGARTLRGADLLADEYKYIPVRRLALFIEESLYRGTQWVVFEPNDEPLWAQIRLNVGAFMHNLFRQGALQGSSPGTHIW